MDLYHQEVNIESIFCLYQIVDVIAKSICLYDSIDHEADDPIEGRCFQYVRYAFLTSLKQKIVIWVENINVHLSVVGFVLNNRISCIFKNKSEDRQLQT